MARLNLLSIALLASCCVPGEAPVMISNPNMADALNRAREKKRLQAEEEAAELLLNALNRVESDKNIYRLTIRNLRDQIAQNKAAMDDLDRCMAYGAETSNYIPLFVRMGYGCGGRDFGITDTEYVKLSKVPENWKPAAPAENKES